MFLSLFIRPIVQFFRDDIVFSSSRLFLFSRNIDRFIYRPIQRFHFLFAASPLEYFLRFLFTVAEETRFRERTILRKLK